MKKHDRKPEEIISPFEEPALTPEARENQLISLSERLAEKQLREGTASSQVIVHYLRLGTMRERLERDKLKYETELLKSKKEAIDSEKRSEELFSKAISAFRSYRGEDETADYQDI
ncbi:MAG: hypothetical protein J6S78_06110 [Lachnospiraceae bacterium]|nr:hypothetical protein [Lachnospiraceae bacterium]